MKKQTILILGGYGGVGRVLSQFLLKETQVNIIIAGRQKEKADECAEKLNKEFTGNRASSCYADASKQESLLKAFQGVQLVIVLTPTPNLISQIGRAALISGCDYLDTLVSESTFYDLNKLAPQILQQQKIFITQAGFHPGLPAVFVRYGAQYFDSYNKAIIAMAMNTRFERAEQAIEFIPLLTAKTDICKNGSWKKATYKDAVTIEMGKRFGKMKLFPIQMEEIKLTQKMFNLKETGAYVSGFNWFVDNLIIPFIMLTQIIKKGFAIGLLTKFFTWGVNTFSSPYQGVVFINEAEGIKDGKNLKVQIIAEYNDAYLFTAIPVVACIKQYLAGELHPGLSMMGHIVDEKRLINDMEKMRVKIYVKNNNINST